MELRPVGGVAWARKTRPLRRRATYRRLKGTEQFLGFFDVHRDCLNGIFRKHNLEFPLVYIGTSPMATAAMLGGEAQVMIDGGVGVVRTVVAGNNDLVFIAGVKNYLTQSILAKPEIKRLEDLRGKKIGVTRIGATTPARAATGSRKHCCATRRVPPCGPRRGPRSQAKRRRLRA